MRIDFQYHPDTEIFPLLEGKEFEELVQDIREHGLREAIGLLPDGKVIDGRNRIRACQEAGVKVRTRTVDLNGTPPIEYVVSANLKRRHLTASQRAACAVAALPRLKAEARER